MRQSGNKLLLAPVLETSPAQSCQCREFRRPTRSTERRMEREPHSSASMLLTSSLFAGVKIEFFTIGTVNTFKKESQPAASGKGRERYSTALLSAAVIPELTVLLWVLRRDFGEGAL